VPNQKPQPGKRNPLFLRKKTIAPQKEEETEEDKDEDPMNSPISRLMSERAAERRRMLKEFNYKFSNNHARIDEIERQPAYKRMGVNLDDKPSGQSNISRTTLSSDEEGIKLRSNNSFLHDNVD